MKPDLDPHDLESINQAIRTKMAGMTDEEVFEAMRTGLRMSARYRVYKDMRVTAMIFGLAITAWIAASMLADTHSGLLCLMLYVGMGLGVQIGRWAIIHGVR